MLAVAFALAITLSLYLRFHPSLDLFVSGADGVLGGYPHWRLFQSRIFAPFFYGLVRISSGLEHAQSFLLALAGLFFGFQVVLMAAVRSLTRNSCAAVLAGVIAFGATVLVVTSKSWFYLWDVVDLSVFCGVAYFLVRGAALGPLCLLIGLEIFNREVAQVLALCLVLDAVIRRRDLSRREFSRRCWAGWLLLVSSAIVSEYFRRNLLVQEIGPIIWPEATSGSFANVQIGHNMGDLLGAFRRFSWDTLRWIGLLAASAGVTWLVSKPQLRSLACFFYPLWVATAVFGVANEWRVWLWMVPFLLIAFAAYQTGLAAARAAELAGEAEGREEGR